MAPQGQSGVRRPRCLPRSRIWALFAFGLASLPGTLAANGEFCPGSPVAVVTEDPAIAKAACRAADAATARFAECGLQMPEQIEIALVNDLPDGCMGVFHCGEGRIDLLPPARMDEVRNSDGAFGRIPTDRYFASVIAHELAHAVYDSAPCPFASCVASAEYFAYNFQIASLPESDRAAVLATRSPQQKVTRDAISAVMLAMAPDRFAVLSYSHAVQRGDWCQQMRDVARGRILFDRERF